jgi:hypothetical protein
MRNERLGEYVAFEKWVSPMEFCLLVASGRVVAASEGVRRGKLAADSPSEP